MSYWLFLMPIIGGLLGWLIHFIAIRYFFRNVLPSKKAMIAKQAGKAAAAEFARFEGLEEKINDPKNLESIMPLIENHIDHFLNEKLKQEMPMISMFVGTKTTDKLKEVFLKEIKSLFPQVIAGFAANLKSSIDIEKIVSTRINALDSRKTEQLIRANVPGLNNLPLLGAYTGFLVGIVQAVITVLTGQM